MYCSTGYIYIQHWGEDIAFFPLGAHKCKIAIFIPTCSCHKINQKMWHFNMWGMHLHILFFKTSFRTRFFMIYSTTWWCAKLIQLCLLIHSKKMFFLKIPTRFGNTCVGSMMTFIHCLCHRINWKWKKILTLNLFFEKTYFTFFGLEVPIKKLFILL